VDRHATYIVAAFIAGGVRRAGGDWPASGLPGRSATTVRKNPSSRSSQRCSSASWTRPQSIRRCGRCGGQLQHGRGQHGPPRAQARYPVRRARDLASRNVAELSDTRPGQPGRPSRSLTLDQPAALLKASAGTRIGPHRAVPGHRDPHRGSPRPALGRRRLRRPARHSPIPTYALPPAPHSLPPANARTCRCGRRPGSGRRRHDHPCRTSAARDRCGALNEHPQTALKARHHPAGQGQACRTLRSIGLSQAKVP
jgi:hypothetical protein